MLAFKCKMCGGTLEFSQGASVAECSYCGTMQTVSKSSDEYVQNLFGRANNLRSRAEFDKAEETYTKILEKDDTDAEAHWGMVLCKYGIEYVDDPATGKKVPTCHRTLYESVLTDADYEATVNYADAQQRSLYEEEAKRIDRLQKDILAIVKNEKPFDVFICYKESDDGKRTQDSVIANDIYYQLTQEGFKVFYAAITLEDKIGAEYEPYIFAALNSARVMLVLGTKPEYFTAVWVKNEWSRFMKLMKTDRSKQLFPCYRDMDAYDLPEEFSHLQAQDMSKIGFINDLARGIKKVLQKDEKPSAQTVERVLTHDGGDAETRALLKRAFMFAEDGDFASASDYCEKVLDRDPECADAYLGKLLADFRVESRQALRDVENVFVDNANYQKYMRFSGSEGKAEMEECLYHIAQRAMDAATDEESYRSAAEQFLLIKGIKDAEQKYIECMEKAEYCRQDAIYMEAQSAFDRARTENAYKNAAAIFASIPGFRDADERHDRCIEAADIAAKEAMYIMAQNTYAKIDPELNKDGLYTKQFLNSLYSAEQLFNRIGNYKDSEQKLHAVLTMKARIIELDKLANKRNKRRRTIATSVVIGVIVAVIAIAIINHATWEHRISTAYKEAVEGEFDKAFKLLEKAGSGSASRDMAVIAERLEKSEEYLAAAAVYSALGDNATADRMTYTYARIKLNEGKYLTAYKAFCELDANEYAEVGSLKESAYYNYGKEQMAKGNYQNALMVFNSMQYYEDAAALAIEANYRYGMKLIDEGKTAEAHKTMVEVAMNYKLNPVIAAAAQVQQLRGAKVGDTVIYGGLTIDGNITSYCSWKVCSKKGGKLLLLSNNAVGYMNYASSWNKSKIRSWLNNVFYNNYFTDDTRDQIVKTKITAANVSGAKNTNDYIFILSKSELEKYCSNSYKTPNVSIAYWLRSTSESSLNGKVVNFYVDILGNITSRTGISSYSYGIRPAMWVRIPD